MIGVRQILKLLSLSMSFYISGECFLLVYSKEGISASSLVEIGYFTFILIVTCLFFYWRRNDGIGKRLILLLLIWLLNYMLELLMAGLGVSLALQKLFCIQDIGEFGIAATEMLKGSILFRAMLSATVISEFVLSLYRLRKRRKN